MNALATAEIAAHPGSALFQAVAEAASSDSQGINSPLRPDFAAVLQAQIEPNLPGKTGVIALGLRQNTEQAASAKHLDADIIDDHSSDDLVSDDHAIDDEALTQVVVADGNASGLAAPPVVQGFAGAAPIIQPGRTR